MHLTKRLSKHAIRSACLALALNMCGCGGGLAGAGDPVPPRVDASLYSNLLSYCNVPEPSGTEATRDGWITHLYSFGQDGAITTGMVSAAGSTSKWDTPLSLDVHLDRGGSAYSPPEWKMGVRFPTVLGKQSVACVRQASHTDFPPSLNLPGAPVAPALAQLVWDSYWDRALPISKLVGRAIDGFEFVSNFTPDEGEVFFNVGKTDVTASAGISVCYLAPKSVQWDCAQPDVADGGTIWKISARRLKPGVYVLVSAF